MQVKVNGDAHEVARPCTVAQLLDRLGLPDSGVAVARDGIVVPKSGWDAPVGDGDGFEVLTAVQGG
ncbi:sulfur carrier protein ThiS [Tomitella fengzijianii]|uniref:Sulfur carrier protein ThiS n=1 Tax=Tomitella fengzijianii TaxID=2597660 RepID=A0A516X6U8_9ACTN|nr:sulfur carrier protein ThiS [Tomitella fengzijianii]QDQ98381.1 sulfur carrier protein ThiS [Tomitella fengzijianii]